MKLSQIIIKEDNEPDYTGIDDNIRQRLSNYKSHEQQWVLTELRKGENIESIIDGLEYYREKIKDNRYQQIMKPITNPANPKSLIQITLQQIKAGQQQYDAKYGGISKRGAKKKAKETKREYMSTLINEQDLKVIKIEKTDDTTGAAEAAREIAKGTKWCVSHIGTGDNYLKKGPLYYIEYNRYKIFETVEKYLCHIESGQLMDANDQEYRIGIRLYRRLVKHIKGIGIFLKNKKSPEYKDAIKHSPILAYTYALKVIKDRWPEAEPYIIKDLEYAYLYARDVIEGSWPELEPIIMQDPRHAYLYAYHVVKGRWREAEPIIIQQPNYAYLYACYVIKGRWPEAEQYIMKDPFSGYQYACDVIKGRWSEAEQYIMKHPEWVCNYARDVIKGRWREAEPIIMQDPRHAYLYAYHVVNGRWRKAEPYIMQDPDYAYRYALDVIKGRWPEAEPYIIREPSHAYHYACHVIKGRWQEAEPIIMKNRWLATQYTRRFSIERMFDESQYKDPSTFMNRTQMGTQYCATNINDTVHDIQQTPKLYIKRKRKARRLG